MATWAAGRGAPAGCALQRPPRPRSRRPRRSLCSSVVCVREAPNCGTRFRRSFSPVVFPTSPFAQVVGAAGHQFPTQCTHCAQVLVMRPILGSRFTRTRRVRRPVSRPGRRLRGVGENSPAIPQAPIVKFPFPFPCETCALPFSLAKEYYDSTLPSQPSARPHRSLQSFFSFLFCSVLFSRLSFLASCQATIDSSTTVVYVPSWSVPPRPSPPPTSCPSSSWDHSRPSREASLLRLPLTASSLD